MVRILLETDPLEAQGLDEGDGGSVARVYLGGDLTHPVVSEKVLE